MSHSLRLEPDGVTVPMSSGSSILEAARDALIPIVWACGGNARCTTCRVRVTGGGELCPPPSPLERSMLERMHLPPDVRLACQLRTPGDVAVTRLVIDDDDMLLVRLASDSACQSVEKSVAVLFSDLRGFTSFSEALPPYDVIHVLQRYFLKMSRLVETHGGRVENYMGDGMLAVFIDRPVGELARSAVTAGLEMLAAMPEFQAYLNRVYGRSVDIGVGVHVGTAVFGEVGTEKGHHPTVIGDDVNFASRIESANKLHGTRLLVSEETHQVLGPHLVLGKSFEAKLAGKSGLKMLYEVTGLAPADPTST